MNDLISRQAVIDALIKWYGCEPTDIGAFEDIIEELSSAQPEPPQVARDIANIIENEKDMRVIATQRWIPCSSGNLPQTTDPVNITWTNRNPEPYYASIKDVPFTATGHYCNGKWWWYSATCQDYLDEYGESEVDRVDDGIEILAWQPLPEPYKADMNNL